MRVLLLQPPVEDFYTTAIRTYPFGLACLAAILEAGGHTVTILDTHETGHPRDIPVPKPLNYLKEFYRPGNRSPFKLFGHYRRFGPAPATIAARIAACRPDVVGISAMFTPYAGTALECAGLVREAAPEAAVVLGGAHVTVAPGDVLADPRVDWVVIGEGEQPLAELLRALDTGRPSPEEIPAIGGKTLGGRTWINEGLSLLPAGSDLPIPARHLLDPARYVIGGRRYTMIQTARGCPHRCSFCSVVRLSGTRIRRRTPAAVVAEMLECRRLWDIEIFDIEDDHFPPDEQIGREFLDRILAEPDLAGIELTAMNGIASRPLSPELLRTMKSAGFRSLNLALVSSHRSSRIATGRPDTPKHFLEMLDESGRLGLQPVSYLIIGLPGESPSETLETILTLLPHPGIIGPSVLYATPGTRLYDEEAPTVPSLLLRSTAAAIARPDYTTRQQLTLLAIVRFANYLKSLVPDSCSPTVAEIRETLCRRFFPDGPPTGPFCFESRGESAASLLTAACLASGCLMGLDRQSRRPLRFRIQPEQMEHALFREFIERADRVPIGPGWRPADDPVALPTGTTGHAGCP